MKFSENRKENENTKLHFLFSFLFSQNFMMIIRVEGR